MTRNEESRPHLPAGAAPEVPTSNATPPRELSAWLRNVLLGISEAITADTLTNCGHREAGQRYGVVIGGGLHAAAMACLPCTMAAAEAKADVLAGRVCDHCGTTDDLALAFCAPWRRPILVELVLCTTCRAKEGL